MMRIARAQTGEAHLTRCFGKPQFLKLSEGLEMGQGIPQGIGKSETFPLKTTHPFGTARA